MRSPGSESTARGDRGEAPRLGAALRTAALGVALVAIGGCFEAGYVLQAAQGQLDLLCSTRDIDRALQGDDLEDYQRELLGHVADIKAFASASGLVPTPSYEEFVQLDRPVAVWVVSASHPLRFESVRWTFPIVGSVPYLGWFDRTSAEDFADELREAGWDVDQRGARAYSTLGWFDDPVLSSMLQRGPDGAGELANTVLHESLHATVYIPSQSSFNESVASFVGDELAGRWLEERFGAGSPELVSFQEGLLEGEARTARLHRAFEDLDALYRSKKPRQAILEAKREYLAALRDELDMRREPNNASLMGFKTYESGREELVALHAACGRDMRRFVGAIATVSDTSFDEPQQEDVAKVVGALVARGCPKK